MKQHFINKSGHGKLLLFFAGWGMDERPFLSIRPTACDWMICYDYRSLSFDETLIEGYSDITLVAWSMGVWAASQVMKLHPSLPVTERIAINGTLYPVSKTRGISPATFEATLQNLNDRTVQKFQRRMCGTPHEYEAFQAVAPQRPVAELKEELATIGLLSQSLPSALCHWQKAIIGTGDYIFLPRQQKAGWETSADSLIERAMPHYDRALFKEILHPNAHPWINP